MIRLAVFLLLMLVAAPATAQESIDSTPSAAQQGTRVVTDEETGTIRFLIEDREIVRIDATGLHVRENLNYGGMFTDYGKVGFAAHTAADQPAPDDAP